MLVHLPSVASYIDTTDALVYAAYQKGGVDPDSAQPISECSSTFLDLLSPQDAQIVHTVEEYIQMHLKFIVNHAPR